MRKPKTIGVGYASLLERLSQTGSGLLSDCAPCGLLECRAHRLPADQQGHRQSPAPAASVHMKAKNGFASCARTVSAVVGPVGIVDRRGGLRDCRGPFGAPLTRTQRK